MKLRFHNLVFYLFAVTLISFYPFTPLSYTSVKDESLKQVDSIVKVEILFAGDAMVHSTQFNSAYNKEDDTYNFDPVFQFIKPILALNDINIINLETTLGGKPYAGYPNFTSPDTFAYSLYNAGFNYLALANNHSVDKGKNGILRTLDVLNNYGIQSVGTYSDSTDRAERYPLIINKNNISIALLNYTYGTNGIAVPAPTIVNLIDTALIREDIINARTLGADFVMVYFHWGNEYARQPSIHQKNVAQFTFKAGADIIIGSHPHVVQPIDCIDVLLEDSLFEKRWVAWSLGNFVSNQRKEHTDGGIMVKFTVEKNRFTNKTRITHMTYIPYWVYRPLNPTLYYVAPISLLEANDTLFPAMNSVDKKTWLSFAENTRTLLKKDSIELREWGR